LVSFKNKKKNFIIIGAQWGDEGKAKMVDVLSEQVDLIARYQGGSNAGHTVVTQNKKIVFHQIPSGILRKNKICIIGNGVVLDLIELMTEIEYLENCGVDVFNQLIISDRTHILLPYHRLLDQARENQKGGSKIGTTNRGIGPAYMDKMGRTGIRMIDLFEPSYFRKKLYSVVKEKNFLLRKYFQKSPIDVEKTIHDHLRITKKIKLMVRNMPYFLEKKLSMGKNLLAEGAQGTLLDIDFGTYPYVTSSNASVGGACTGLGIGPKWFNDVYGVTKAYTTRVGEGPFPTEMGAPLDAILREKGAEFGATTGRPRRCGWLDLVALKYACYVNGFSGLLLTKIDVLSSFEYVDVCVAYQYQGNLITEMPSSLTVLSQCRPVYRRFEGWSSDITKITSALELPTQIKKYIQFIEKAVQVPIIWVSVGQDRKQIFKNTASIFLKI
jgi:adenylosuccinate synthase